MFTRTQKRIFFFLIYIISTRGKARVKAFWGECSPFSSPSMHLFSSTYRIRVKGEGKKAKNSGRARRYAHARNAKKTFVYAFLDKYRETRGAHLCLSHRTDKETRGAAPKNDTSESERVTFRCVRLPKARGKREN